MTYARNIAFAVLLGIAYYWCLTQAVGLVSALVLPTLLPESTVGVLLLQELTHLVALFVSAAPIAAALVRVLTDRAFVWALVVGLGTSLIAVTSIALDPTYTVFSHPLDATVFVWGHIKIAVVPALLVWLFARLTPSNQPLHPTLHGALASSRAIGAGERRRYTS